MSYILGSILWTLLGIAIGFVGTLLLLSAVFAFDDAGVFEGRKLYDIMLERGYKMLSKL